MIIGFDPATKDDKTVAVVVCNGKLLPFSALEEERRRLTNAECYARYGFADRRWIKRQKRKRLAGKDLRQP